MPVCPNCGSQQPDEAAFCDECGAKLGEIAPAQTPPPYGGRAAPAQTPPRFGGAGGGAVTTTCPVCGAPVTPGEVFCDNCGAALGPSTEFTPSEAEGFRTGAAAPVPPPPQAAAPAPPYPAAAPAPAVALVCSNCGAQLEPDSNFCDMCGTPVGVAVPPAPPSTPVPTPPAPAPTPPVYPSAAAVQGRLVVQGTNATLPFPPGKTEIIVGREDPVGSIFPDIDLTDHGGDEGGVSRKHARIFVQGAQVLIEDLNSTNYTFVNQQKLTPGQPQPLDDGDEIWLGRLKLNFYSA